MSSEFKNSVQMEKLTDVSLSKQYLGKQIRTNTQTDNLDTI